MKIYVQSRGQSQDQDYCWIHITDKGQQKESPNLPKEVINLIESDDFSVVIARFSGQLLLLITGLKSGRADFQRRVIRNSIAWLGQDSDEPQFRGLAANALRGFLARDIDTIVKFSTIEKEGFQASWKEIQQLTGKNKVENLPPDSKRKIGKNSEFLRKQLAEELEKCQLPQQEGPLVVVTGIKARETLEKASVWRGLSNSVGTENWEEISNQRRRNSNRDRNWFPNLLKSSIVVLAIVVLGTGILVSSGTFSTKWPLASNHNTPSPAETVTSAAPTATSTQPPFPEPISIDFSSDSSGQPSVSINKPIVFKGNLKQEIKTLIICADEKYLLGIREISSEKLPNEKWKIDFKNHRWSFEYIKGFNTPGEKNISTKNSQEVLEEIENKLTEKLKPKDWKNSLCQQQQTTDSVTIQVKSTETSNDLGQ
ncbi:MAG: hypothetical protein SAK29_08425 [Scytonema sp. PMC 1069.18]|nr:hypothetical protein [Scytonema sp. PMC 1069.18]MEC4880176.1 hypothetical protein [Scytonema sp. PMC 1070.18]